MLEPKPIQLDIPDPALDSGRNLRRRGSIHDYLEAAGHGDGEQGPLFRTIRNNRSCRIDKAPVTEGWHVAPSVNKSEQRHFLAQVICTFEQGACLFHTSPLNREHISFSGDFLWERAAATADKRRARNLGQTRVAA